MKKRPVLQNKTGLSLCQLVGADSQVSCVLICEGIGNGKEDQ